MRVAALRPQSKAPRSGGSLTAAGPQTHFSPHPGWRGRLAREGKRQIRDSGSWGRQKLWALGFVSGPLLPPTPGRHPCCPVVVVLPPPFALPHVFSTGEPGPPAQPSLSCSSSGKPPPFPLHPALRSPELDPSQPPPERSPWPWPISWI